MDPPRINPPELFTRAHKRIPSLSPSRSPTRQRITDDILSDLSPATTLEAFTSPSGKLRASVEAATPSERAFGIRATIASKKIQEWVDELSTWPWPSEAGSVGFEIPAAKRRRVSIDERTPRAGHQDVGFGEEDYIGSLPAEDVARYENRIDDIHEDMDDLNVEEIKSTVLNTHFSPKSRPSSSGSNAPVPSIFSSYTRMNDFTAVVTATVLQALPNLSRLTRLMDVWTVRLLVLRKIPPLLLGLDDAEVALKSGWQAIETPRRNNNGANGEEEEVLDRKTFDIMRDVLQDKVTTLGKDLDYMLDTLEGRRDTLPEVWLDRMETIERDYGEWVVRGDRKVRAGEWAKMAKARKAEADRIKAEKEAREAARLQAEKEQRQREERLRLEQEEVSRLERERKEAEDKLRLEQEASAEAARQAELARKQEEERIVAETEAALQEAERLRLENEERIRLEQEAAAEAARQAELTRRQEETRMADEESARQEAERRRLEAEEQRRLEEEAAAAELARKQEEDRIRTEETARQEAERQRIEDIDRARVEQEAAAAEIARQTELARKRDEDALRLKEQQAAEVAAANALKAKELEMQEEASKSAELARQQTIKDANGLGISREGNASTPKSPLQKVEPDMISPASALALGIGAAITGPFLRSGNGDAKGPENSFQHEALPSESDSTEGPAYGAPSDPTKVETPNLLPTAATELHSPTSSVVPVDNLSSSSPISKFAPFDGSDETHAPPPKPQTALQVPTQVHLQSPPSNDISVPVSSPYTPSTSQLPETPNTDFYPEKASTPPTLSTPSGPVAPNALSSPSARSVDGVLLPEEKESPNSPSRLARFRDRFGIMQFRTSPQSTTNNVRPQSSGSPQLSPPFATPGPIIKSPIVPTEAFTPTSLPSTLSPSSPPLPLRSPARERIDQEWIVVEPPTEEDGNRNSPPLNGSTEASDTDDTCGFKAHNRNISLVSGYSISDPTPEIQEAEPAEYFRPTLSPIKSALATASQSASPSRPPLSDDEKRVENLSSLNGAEPALMIPAESSTERVEDGSASSTNHRPQLLQRSNSDTGSDSALEIAPRPSRESGLEHISHPGLARKTSIARINSPIKRIDIPRRESTASDTSTVLNRQAGDATSSPLTPCCPLSELATADPFPDVDDESPSTGRVRSRIDAPSDRSASGSPPPIPAMSPRRSFHLPKSSSSSKAESESQDPEAPIFDSVDISDGSVWSSPKKSSDDQIQAQISSLLESIPARIRLTSEPDTTPFLSSDTLRPAKTRRSVTPSLRSHSSLSMRAPTPSFTLAPAYGKGTSRPRPQNGNPEIKLYHLSRSTGEAPIKLFVRLVGENGERVMVRVGGGWADLGEYLREYASHHGRRSAVDSDKVEVQDIRPRISSTSSTTSSSATIRGNGRSSPTSRPGSAFDRPMSSLHIRKTRRSVGETDSNTFAIRNPSTPLPMSNRGKEYETPPSEKIRSSSRLSWTEEEGGLGLAGPKAKKVAISERDQEWVESMKEKVRLASAEKEKKEARDRDRKSFGEMDKIGGTKRLFRKG